MADESIPSRYPNLPPDLVEVLVRAHSFAFLTVQPLFWYPNDPVPQELMTRFGLTYEALTAYTHHTDAESLSWALVDEVPSYTYYALAAQQVLQTPALLPPLQAMRKEQAPESNDWDGFSDLMMHTLEAFVQVSSLVAAGGDRELADATLLVQRGEIAGLFARLEHTLRPDPMVLERPAVEPPLSWVLSAGDRCAASMALRLPQALIPLADTRFTQLLRQMPRLQLHETIFLQLRLDALPDSDDPVSATLDVSDDELLLLWQGTELGLMAMYAAITPYGTWEDWLLQHPLEPGESEPALRRQSAEDRAKQHAKVCDDLLRFRQRLQEYLSTTHADWPTAQAEIMALRDSI